MYAMILNKATFIQQTLILNLVNLQTNETGHAFICIRKKKTSHG